MLTSEDRCWLQMFVDQSNRLSRCKFFEKGKPRLALGLGDNQAKAFVPERHEFIEMLVILRPFIMEEDSISFNKIVGIVRKCANNSTPMPNLETLNSVHQRFNVYKERNKTSKYQKNYSTHISSNPDITFDLEERTIFNLIDLIINGYYFHSDLEKQREIIVLLREQQGRWTSLLEEDLTDNTLFIIRERVREAFKYRFYSIAIGIADCVFELSAFVKDLFGYPLDEKLCRESQLLYDFLDI
jgi:hypothetical protein